MLFVTTYCIYKSTSYIYLFNNWREKCTFSKQRRVLRDQISREILVGIVIFLLKIYLSSFTWSKLHCKKLGRDSLYYVLNISYFSHFTSNISGQQCMGLEVALAWKLVLLVWQRNYHVNSFIYKKAIELYCDLWKLFFSKWTEIIVEIQLIWFWLTNILCLLSDYRKEEIIRSMNLINGFGARGYSVLLT